MVTIIGLIYYPIPSNHPLYIRPKRHCRRITTDSGAKMCYQPAGSASTSKIFTFCRITCSPDHFTKKPKGGMTSAVVDAFHSQCRSIENTMKRNYLSDFEEDDDPKHANEVDICSTSPPTLDILHTSTPPTPNGPRPRTSTNLSVRGVLTSSGSTWGSNGYFLPTPSPPAMIIGGSPHGINLDFPPKPHPAIKMTASFPKPPLKDMPKEGSYGHSDGQHKLQKQMKSQRPPQRPPSLTCVNSANEMRSPVRSPTVVRIEDVYMESDGDEEESAGTPSVKRRGNVSPPMNFLGVSQYGSPQYAPQNESNSLHSGSRTPNPVSLRERNRLNGARASTHNSPSKPVRHSPAVKFRDRREMLQQRPTSAKSSKSSKGSRKHDRYRTQHWFPKSPRSMQPKSPQRRTKSDYFRERMLC